VGYFVSLLNTPPARVGGDHEVRRAHLLGHGIVAHYAVLVGGSNGDCARRGLVTIVELIDPRPFIFQSAVCGRLIYTVIHMNDHPSTQVNPDPGMPPPPELRSKLSGSSHFSFKR
jgi:hypothetical protein